MHLRNLRSVERDWTLLSAHLLLLPDIKLLSKLTTIIRQQDLKAIRLFNMEVPCLNKVVHQDWKLSISMPPSRNLMECLEPSQAHTTTLSAKFHWLELISYLKRTKLVKLALLNRHKWELALPSTTDKYLNYRAKIILFLEEDSMPLRLCHQDTLATIINTTASVLVEEPILNS